MDVLQLVLQLSLSQLKLRLQSMQFNLHVVLTMAQQLLFQQEERDLILILGHLRAEPVLLQLVLAQGILPLPLLIAVVVLELQILIWQRHQHLLLMFHQLQILLVLLQLEILLWPLLEELHLTPIRGHLLVELGLQQIIFNPELIHVP